MELFQKSFDMNTYYSDFCARAERWAAQREKDDPMGGATIIHDHNGKVTPESQDVIKDLCIDRLARQIETPLGLPSYRAVLEMRLFDLVATFASAAQDSPHPDNTTRIYARADGFVAVIEQAYSRARDDNLGYASDADGNPVMVTKVESVTLYGVMQKNPDLIHFAKKAFHAKGMPPRTEAGWAFFVDAKTDTGRIIDSLSPVMITPWPIATENILIGGYESFNSAGADLSLIMKERNSKLPLHIRQMLGFEPFAKDPSVFARSSENAGQLVHYVPKKLRFI